MCGIAGIYSQTPLPDDTGALLGRMLARIRYRGPDESGIYINRHLAFGNVRLSIIDIQTGQQPMASADGKYRIVFNGEIFNYIELRKELVKLGYQFKTESDTEVLLYAYIHFGASCLEMLNGQFVFAVWNNETEELFIARDRHGIRPLFYTWKGNNFVFGSEIKTLFEHPDVSAAIEISSLSEIFTFWTTITPKTVFKGIYELSPASYLKIKSGQMIIRSYWSLKFPEDEHQYFKGSFADAVVELERLLEDAVRMRLRADVPVAAYLSGGLDSSATTALIKKVMPETLQTFSIGFEDKEFDETSYQQKVADFLKTKHTAYTCTREDIGACFPQVVWHTETPILRTAPVPMFCLSQKVRENNIKVVITGEGADEMLAGYDIFKEAIIREFWSREPGSKLRPLLFQKLYPYLEQFQGKNMNVLKLFFGHQLQDTNAPFYSHILRWKNTANIHNLFSEDIRELLKKHDGQKEVSDMLPKGFGNYDLLGKSQWLESVIFMSGYLLSSQGDRMAMANSVEGRYPFLDYRVVEFAATLPPAFKMRGLNEKYILKKMMHNRLPKEVLNRPKQAYRSPIAGSFLSKSAKDYTLELLSEPEITRTHLFDYQLVNKLVKKISSGAMVSEIENMALAGILSTQLLMHQYVFRDGYRPEINQLKNCRIIRENNTVYTQ
ncbi:MAG: asparagine synthase (glutamine-hydrolyzing) [Bacteroidales bacterium]|nr:asparagine synthase (glutamine-hydrolyzing) [Bacteroidales bacterium]